MKPCKTIRKKSLKKNATKKLLRKAMNLCEKEMKAAVHRRDKVCQLCKSSNVSFDVDHFISRRNMATYFDINNLTLLCKSCHVKKSFGYQDYEMRVMDVVCEREGKDVCEELRTKSRQIKKWDIDTLTELAKTYSRLFL